LALGASDYVPKPRGLRDPSEGFAYVKEHVLPRILALSPPAAQEPSSEDVRPRRRSTTSVVPPRRTAVPARVDVVAIGASTGGPNALIRLFERVPASLQAPVLIVQHMPPLFTRMLAERLTARTSLVVREAADGDVASPGEALVAPGDRHMIVDD